MSAYRLPVVSPFTTCCRKKCTNPRPRTSLRRRRRAPNHGRTAAAPQLVDVSRSRTRDEPVLALLVELEREELGSDQVALRGELDRLAKDRLRLVRLLDLLGEVLAELLSVGGHLPRKDHHAGVGVDLARERGEVGLLLVH